MNGSANQTYRDPHDSHCKIAGCRCTHDGDCYRGWIDITEDDRDYALPCSTCRPAQRRVTQQSPDRHAMQERLRERAMSKQWTGA